MCVCAPAFVNFSRAILNFLNQLLKSQACPKRLASSYGTRLALQLPDALSLALAVVVVAILGALSARWSVTRNTRF